MLDPTAQTYWIHNLDPYVVSSPYLQLPFYWLTYPFAYFFIYGQVWMRARSTRRQHDWHWQNYLQALPWGWLGMLIGARLFYALVYFPAYFLENPAHLHQLWRGGMSFHGGVIGGALAIWLFCRRQNLPCMPLLDLVACHLPIALFFGRIANFINGELAGRPTDVAWAVIFPNLDQLPRHPSQLYEAVAEGLVLWLIVLWTARRHPYGSGKCSGSFLLFYGLLRFCVEFTRAPDRQIGLVLGAFTLGQLLCLATFLTGGLLLRIGPMGPSQGCSKLKPIDQAI